jgi:predicted acetyltransferase
LPQRSLAPSRPLPHYRNHDASIAKHAGFQGIFYLTNGSAAAKVTIAGNATIELETDDLAAVVHALVG